MALMTFCIIDDICIGGTAACTGMAVYYAILTGVAKKDQMFSTILWTCGAVAFYGFLNI